MTTEEFDRMVFGLEGLARRKPKVYQLRVLLLAMLGNAYLGFVLLVVSTVLVALLVSVKAFGALALKLIMIVAIFLWMLLKSLWVKFTPPKGMKIRVGEAPALFAMIRELSEKLGAPRFHEVLVSEELNAGVLQLPRLGIFGWHRNYLMLGLPLMKSLTVEQFRAVLAHEFGHLAKGHGRISNWVYLQRLRWSRLMGQLEASHSKGSILFAAFFNWYGPYFNAYSFPLARANEYEADATSVRLTSAHTVAEALTNVDVVCNYINERYWPQIYRQADDLPQPSIEPFARMGEHFALDLDQETAKGWLDRAVANQTTSADTHPALADRLKAIGETPRLNPPKPGGAADQLLGDALVPLTDGFDRRWQEYILPAWQERHEQVRLERHRLVELIEKYHECGELSPQDAYERARLTESVGQDADAALGQFRALLDREPDNALFSYAVGVRLLALGDEEACELIERAMLLDEEAAASGCEALRDYCLRVGRVDEAKAWHQRMTDSAQLQQLANRERSQLLAKDQFAPHGLAGETLAPLRAELASVRGLRKAYFVQKCLKHQPHRALYVLGYTVTGRFRLANRRRAAEVLEQIKACTGFPGQTLIINLERGNARFERKFSKLDGARIV